MTFPFRTISYAATGCAAVASALAYPFLPERVATHFDADGRPDRESSRRSAALQLPALMAALAVLNDLLAAWPGSRDREDRDSGVRARDQAIALTELALLPSHLSLLARGVGMRVDPPRITRAVNAALIVALGNLLPRLPRNGLVGIRTPWTLADPTVWERTHRVGGYLVSAAGLVSLLSLPASGRRASRLSSAAILTAVGLSAAYSYVAFRRRDRETG